MFSGLNKFLKVILPKRLFYRALIIVAAPTIILQLIITIVFYDSIWIKANKNITRSLVSQLKTIQDVYQNNKNNLDHNNKNGLRQNKFWCALSTHAEESNFCLRTHYKIKKIHNDVITIIIPRHIEDSNKIALNGKKLNLSCQILNINDLIKKESEIIIINSYGEIPKYLEFCNSVFVGKSLLKKKELVGGQNPIEAAKFGCKIYHGPYVRNFEEVYSLFNEYKISEKIYTEDELSNK